MSCEVVHQALVDTRGFSWRHEDGSWSSTNAVCTNVLYLRIAGRLVLTAGRPGSSRGWRHEWQREWQRWGSDSIDGPAGWNAASQTSPMSVALCAAGPKHWHAAGPKHWHAGPKHWRAAGPKHCHAAGPKHWHAAGLMHWQLRGGDRYVGRVEREALVEWGTSGQDACKGRRQRWMGVRAQRCGIYPRARRAAPNHALLLAWPSAFQAYSSLGTYCIVSPSYQQSATPGIRPPHAHRTSQGTSSSGKGHRCRPVPEVPCPSYTCRTEGRTLVWVPSGRRR